MAHSLPALPPSEPTPHPEDPENRKAAPKGGLPARCPGGDLLSHPVARAVPSALEGFTSGFGMGPGVSPPLWPPKRRLPIAREGVGGTAPEQSSGTSVPSAMGSSV